MGCDLSLPSPPASQTLRSSSFPYASPYSIQPILTIPRPPVPISHLPNLLPSSVSRKAFVCHSCENCRGLGVFFPFWKTLRAYGDENSHFTQVFSFHIVAHSLAHAKTQLFSFQPLPHSLSQNTGGWGYPLVPPHSPHSTEGCSCWLPSGWPSPLPSNSCATLTMRRPMNRASGLRIGKILGIPIYLHSTWLFIFAAITWF